MSAGALADRPRVLAPFGRRRAEVVGAERYGAYVVLSAADPDGPRPDPGQFYMLAAAERWGGGADERPFLPRAFSVARTRAGGTLEFLLEVVGPGTERLAELGRADGLWLLGPLGNGFAAERDGSRRAILVGGGVGIAPLAILADALGPAALPLLGFRDGQHAEGARWFAERGARPRVATDDGSAGHHGTVLDLLREELGRVTSTGGPSSRGPQGETPLLYACGPAAMLEPVRALCAELRVPAQLALESGMACGYGACFGCVAPTRHGYVRLCVDGPVLDAGALDHVTHD